MVHLVLGNIDDQEAAARRYRARRLPHGACRVNQIVQHLMNDNEGQRRRQVVRWPEYPRAEV